MDICKKHLSVSDLLVQSGMEALGELVEASSLPVFSSDRIIDLGYEIPGRIAIPISDEDGMPHTGWYAAPQIRRNTVPSLMLSAVMP